MRQVCAPLDEVISDSLANHEAAFETQMGLLGAVPACEAATRNTRKVEELVP